MRAAVSLLFTGAVVAIVPCPRAPSSLNLTAITEADMMRAVNKVPRVEFKGSGIAHMANTLNTHLMRMASANDDLTLKRCEDMSHSELHELQMMLVENSHPDFQQLYESAEDNRRYRFCGASELSAKYSEESRIVSAVPKLADVLRDSKCRESVMWYVHHLRSEDKKALSSKHPSFVLPTLPETEVRPDPEISAANPSEAKTIYRAYDDSLQCTTCHSLKFPTDHVWPSGAGINTRTGATLPSWPDHFSVDFLLEVTTEPNQYGLPNITNASGNSFHYSYSQSDPSLSRAVNIHKTCPFFHDKSCNIHHHPDGIWLNIEPDTAASFCCLFQAGAAVIPPFWTTWGLFVDTYEKNDPVPGEAAPNWEGFVVDRYIYGDAAQLDEHDLHVRATNPKELVRFHATLPPPNAHSHGYWHVQEDMKVEYQNPKLFELPSGCLPSCGIGETQSQAKSSGHPLFSWGGVNTEHLKTLMQR